MLKGVIFDMDGTLTLTEVLHHRAFAQVFREYGIDFSYQEEVTKYAGAGSRVAFTSVFKEHGKNVSDEEIQTCIDKKRSLYTKFVQEEAIPMVDGAKEFVQKVEKLELKKIIATGNGDLNAVRFILKKVGLLEFFPLIVSIQEVADGKPSPDVFLEAARRIECDPSDCVVFEDGLNGVTAARAAGIRCIALETTTKRELLLNAGASVVVKNYYGVTDSLLFNQN